MFRLVSSTLWVVVICFSGFSVYAQTPDAPTEAEVLAIISSEVPDYFEVSDLALSAPSTSGAAGRMRFIYSFGLGISAKEQLYSITREIGPFAIVLPTIGEGDLQRISGVLDMSKIDEAWTSGVSIEQDIEKFGLPIDQFGQPVLIAGDPETETRLAQLRAEKISQAAELVRTEIAAEEAELRAVASENLAAERAKNAAEILEIIADHATRRGNLIATQRQQIAELETGLAIERQNLLRQVNAAQEVLALQNALLASLATIAAIDAEALEAFTNMRAERLRLLDALPKRWAGIVNCADNNAPEKTITRTIEIEVQSVQSSGFSIRVEVDRSGSSGQISILDDVIAFPMRLGFSIPGADRSRNGIPDSFVLELSSDGKMKGTAPYQVMWSGDTLSSQLTCAFEISG